MILVAAASTDVGRRRSQNQDRFAVEPRLGLCLVADGMGGHLAGQMASRLAAEAAVRAIAELAGQPAALARKLSLAVSSANRAVYRVSRDRPDCAGMGTTLVAFLLEGERAALAHVGDSRAYQVRGGRIRRLTQDHSLVGDLLRRGEISARAARQHPHRHVLTRAVGVRQTVTADVAEMRPEAGDLFLLCSDGLTNHVGEREIARLVASGGGDLEKVCRTLVDLANARGGEDNSTVVLVRCDAGLAEPAGSPGLRSSAFG